MTDVMMMLGTYEFSIETAAYDTLTRTHAYRWPKQDRLGRLPARQFVGPDAGSLTLRGTVFPTYAGGLGQIDAMRAEASQGASLLLVDGRGFIWGDWVIERIEETQRRQFRDGVPRRIDFTVKLSEYGADA